MEKINKLIEGVQKLNPKRLTKKQILKIITDFGIVYEPRSPYGEWNEFMVKDLGIYQTPGQIAEAIYFLSKHQINSYLELGVYHGGNYLLLSQFLKLFNPDVKCLGVDLDCRFLHAGIGEHVQVVSGTSNDYKGQSFDLVHIDADHQYASVKQDWENVGKYAKICMFHDINDDTCPGSKKLWNEIKQGKEVKEFLYQTDGKNVHGIGIIIN